MMRNLHQVKVRIREHFQTLDSRFELSGGENVAQRKHCVPRKYYIDSNAGIIRVLLSMEPVLLQDANQLAICVSYHDSQSIKH